MERGRRRRTFAARNADKYELYTLAVQTADQEIAFIDRVYRKANGHLPSTLREDFCGTAAICCEWIKLNATRHAVGVDLDPVPLQWGREHHLARLHPGQRKRIRLLQKNVLEVRASSMDVIAALNFSFCIFKRRAVLIEYLRRCRSALKHGGIMVMDIYGGPESHKPNRDKTRYQGFIYVWDQARFNPITNEALNHIHFHFPDGSKMTRAFTYDWRLWTPAELTEAMLEVGFKEARVYWEGTTDDGRGNGIFRWQRRAEVDDAWIVYVVGFR